tara:strand:+ start:13865 stop:15487 length:1623 start_codon:yes stop_codon:yes gene_type:complete
MPRKLRIGLIINDFKVSNWIFHIIQHISQSNNFEISLVIILPNLERRKNFLFRNFIKYDSQRYPIKPDALKIRSLLDIKNISETQSLSLSSYNYESITSEIDSLKIQIIDVFLKFDTTHIIYPFIKYTNYGVWSHYLGEYYGLSPELYGVQEFLEKQYVTKITLSAWNKECPTEIKLFESYSKTDNNSLYRSLNNSYWKAVSFIPRKLQEIHQQSPVEFFNKTDVINSALTSYYDRPYTIPKNRQLLSHFFKHVLTKLKTKILDYFYFNQWILLFKLNNKLDIYTTFFKFKRITSPKDRFWADPFIVYKDNTYYIFIEELLYKTNKGTIAVIEMDENGKYEDPKPVLEKDYHLSYPFIIEELGKYYMIPETKGNKTIELYECVDFPLKWIPKEILFKNIEAVDSTILKHEGKYWLFTNIKENTGTFTSDDELFLYYSNSLLNGNWISHPQNPIVSDVRYARPAGKIIKRNGRLFRPAQNCSKHYGYGIQLNEIIILTEEKYLESKVQSIFPDWDKDLNSTHTINSEGYLTVIDGKIKRRR